MYQFSDSDSVDSDEGIRYKTESIRNKKLDDKDVEKRKESHRYRDRRRSRSRSRSRHHKDKKKMKERKRGHSPKENSHRRTSGTKNRESERTESRRTRKEKDRKNIESNTGHINKSNKKEPVLPQKDEKPKCDSSNSTVKEKCIAFGPSVPKRESTGNLEKEPNPQLKEKSKCDSPKSVESNTPDLTFGPALPPQKKTTKTENEDEKHSQNGNTFGPKLPPKPVKIPGEQDNVIGPVLPSHFITVSSLDDDSSSDKDSSDLADKKSVIGPSLPPHLPRKTEEKVIEPSVPHLQQQSSSDTQKENEEDSDNDVYGPVPVGADYSQAHVELEERALKMKMDQLDPSSNKQPVREEWMLTLPQAKAANLGLGPRQFRSKGGPDLSDRSSWTDTPEDKAKKKEGKVEPVIDLKREAELKQIRNRNVEQEKIVKTHVKEKDSLVEIHRKKLKKEKKNESGPSERRPFSRETDLQVNRFDEAQKKAILKKAQLLDNRFSSGESKFL